MGWTRIMNPDQALLDRLLSEASRPCCPDCKVSIGDKHLPGCDVERCGKCGGQRLSCGCSSRVSSTRWDGSWPWSKEAYDWKLVVEMHGHVTLDYNTVSSMMQSNDARFQHWKGGVYTVLGVCVIEKTCEPGVKYQSDTSDIEWCRSISEFLDGRYTPMGKGALAKANELREYSRVTLETLKKDGRHA